jgi:hypothetical protein
MNFTATYLLGRLFYRVTDFLVHWYIKSAFMYSNFVINYLELIDKTFAWKITAKNIFKPLYGDYSFLGYIFGFFFRLIRLIVASVVYVCLFIIAVGIYIIWIFFPPFLLYKAITS